MSTLQQITGMTVARSALNLIAAAGVSPMSIWTALQARAVRTEPDRLEFADGSVLRIAPQSAGFIAS